MEQQSHHAVLAVLIERIVHEVASGDFSETPLIELESALGTPEFKRLMSDSTLSSMANALDFYYYATEHDEASVNGVATAVLGQALRDCVGILRGQDARLPSVLTRF